MYLQSLGATPAIYGAFQPHAAHGLILARVAISQRDQYRLYSDSGELDGEPSGALWHRTPDRASMPVVGDWVAARDRRTGAGNRRCGAAAHAPCSRAGRPGRREDQQPIAANIDIVFLVCGLDGDFNLRRLERYLALTAESGAAPVIVLNKSDACADLAVRIEETATVAGAAPIVACSARDAAGLEALDAFLGIGTDGRAARVVRRRQVDHRQSPARGGPFPHQRCARVGQPRAATPRRIANWSRCPGEGP